MRRGLGFVTACAALGFPAGAVWLLLADPAQWFMTSDGLVMSEELVTGQFDVFATFVVIGIMVGFVIGLTAGLFLKPLDWKALLLTVPAAFVAAVVTWLVGSLLGPGEVPSVAGVVPGDLVPAAFRVDSLTAFLVWPAVASFVATGWTWVSDWSGREVSD